MEALSLPVEYTFAPCTKTWDGGFQASSGFKRSQQEGRDYTPNSTQPLLYPLEPVTAESSNIYSPGLKGCLFLLAAGPVQPAHFCI